MMEQTLIITGASILGILGLIHLIYGMMTNKFDSHDESLNQSMKKATLVITKQTTMWRAWMGFNHSHSFGVIWIPMVYLPITLNYFEVLKESILLAGTLPFMALVYALLAKRYWFNIPLIGSAIAFLCFAAAFYLLHLN